MVRMYKDANVASRPGAQHQPVYVVCECSAHEAIRKLQDGWQLVQSSLETDHEQNQDPARRLNRVDFDEG